MRISRLDGDGWAQWSAHKKLGWAKTLGLGVKSATRKTWGEWAKPALQGGTVPEATSPLNSLDYDHWFSSMQSRQSYVRRLLSWQLGLIPPRHHIPLWPHLDECDPPEWPNE